MTGLGTERTPLSTSHLPPAPREPALANDVWVSLSVAVVLGLTAVTIGLWPTKQPAETASRSGVPTLPMKDPRSSPPSGAAPVHVQNLPTRFTNPFDASEVFEFPPGTSEDAARQSVAKMLLQRARERRAHISSTKHAHNYRSAPLRTSTLMSESLFK